MDNKWRWSQVTYPRVKQVNESCGNFRSRTTFIFNPRTQLESGHRQSHCRSWNWARSTSKNNSENCLIFCLSSVRPIWDLFTPFTIWMRFLLKNIWAAISQAWDKELSAKHSKLVSDWRSELREIRTMSINRLHLEMVAQNWDYMFSQTRPKKRFASRQICKTKQRWNSPLRKENAV